MSEIKKLEKDGKVAVLVSPGYGAGWSTWGSSDTERARVFDADIAAAILEGNKVKARDIASQKYPDHYLGGIDDLVVEWIEKGQPFEIHEYDGSESLRLVGSIDWHIA